MQLFFYIFILFSTIELLSQTLPELYNLNEGKYEFTEWNMNSEEGTYPQNMLFHQTSKIDPKLDDEMTSDWILPYNLTSGSRIKGEDTLGIIFINTSVKNDDGGYLGAAVLGLSTKKCKNIKVSWKGITNEPNDRIYSIALQYMIGNSEYKNTGLVYMMENKRGASKLFSDILLPSECEDRDSVYLRWKYFFTANDEGERAKLGIDDIVIESEVVSNIDKEKNENIIINHHFDDIMINSEKSFDCDVSIVNLKGNIVFMERVGLPFVYDISGLPKGVYFVSVVVENLHYTKMILR